MAHLCLACGEGFSQRLLDALDHIDRKVIVGAELLRNEFKVGAAFI